MSYSTYQKVVKEQNITFTKLGNEECELCLSLSHQHTFQDHQQCDSSCDACAEKKQHDRLVQEARKAYEQDGAFAEQGCIVRRADLQKVIMLPAIPGVKSVCFTRRIIAFHETFAPVRAYNKTSHTISCVWHEAVAGRKAEEIASTFLTAIKQDRDERHVVYYVDNCTAQNKNWCVITSLTNQVNTSDISAETITLKYPESGHTFMSADSVHAEVEKRMRQVKNVYDFDDFCGCVKGRNIDVVQMSETSFLNLEGLKSQPKLKRANCHLKSMRVIQFRRGERKLFFKKKLH